MQRRTFLQALAAALAGAAVARVTGSGLVSGAEVATRAPATAIDWTQWHCLAVRLTDGRVRVDGQDVTGDPAAMAMVRQFVHVPEGHDVIKLGTGIYDLALTNPSFGFRCEVPDDVTEFSATVRLQIDLPDARLWLHLRLDRLRLRPNCPHRRRDVERDAEA